MDATATSRPPGLALFAQGFRPFFLLAGLLAVAVIAAWVAALHGAALPEGPLPHWHAHEMLAGFVGAAMSGFLLTAVPNWTGRPGYGGAPLVLPVALFVLARLALAPGSPVPIGLAAALALLPLPVLLLTVLPALIRAGRARLFGPPALVLGFWVGDLLMLGDAAGWFHDTGETGEHLMLNLALALVGLIGGRIVPSFTVNALRKLGRDATLRPLPGVDTGTVAALLAVALVDLVAEETPLAGAVAAAAAVLALLRLSRWHGLATLDQPILWVLHLAYLFIPVALGLKALHLLAGAGWAANWLHVQAIGAIALMILAVMTRATLGHTGRELRAPPSAALAYALLPLAALARAFGPFVLPGSAGLALAGALWLAAFALFLWGFAPMLLAPRPDGKPG
ncbi:NnrS family protein [Caldovatus aquaticus]|uniref:NnrS family protein n=1 Tax=Caldovatus aquaticus TaxID=2865671 RepID=A0ABS7EZS6_9PROT|nr:NnrS family protein [Caldovatus aquaticus]MBW8268863.1 NnrS family protein [Caldovatus aquaticus]